MNDKIKVVCAWCGTVLQEGPELNGQVSHGICKGCSNVQIQIFRFRKLIGLEKLDHLEDKEIWDIYKDSQLMARIRLSLAVEEFQRCCSKVGVDLQESVKKIRNLFHAKNP